MNYIVSIEGQSIPVEADVAMDDEKLKAALTPYFPGAANSKVMRSEPKEDVITVTVVKQAGTKGTNEILQKLIDAPEGQNPVVELHQRIDDLKQKMTTLPADQLVEMDEQITKSLEDGREEYDGMVNTFDLLEESPAVPSVFVPEGF